MLPLLLPLDKLDLVTHYHLLTRIPVKLELVIARPKSDKEAWDFISGLVKDNKWSRTTALKMELRSIKLGDLSMEAYFQKIESLMTIIANLDSPVSDEDVVHYVLDGLPERYNQVCGYMHYKDTFLDLKTARSLLIAEEMRLKSKSFALPVDSSSSHMVLLAESGTSRRPSNPQVKSWRPCFSFAKGSCRFGIECRYVHDENVKPNATGNPRQSSNNTDALLLKLLDKLGLHESETNRDNNHTSKVAPLIAYTATASSTPLYCSA
ncbi:ribonuclease H-like domain-containing protein [Tanacetum coccineum]